MKAFNFYVAYLFQDRVFDLLRKKMADCPCLDIV